MTREKAVEILENGEWWDNLDEYYKDANPECEKLYNAVDMAVDTIRTQIEAEKNEPLTLEELRQMHGEPVWVVCLKPHLYKNPPTKWNILEKIGSFGIWRDGDCLIARDYGITWLAYRHKPKERIEK